MCNELLLFPTFVIKQLDCYSNLRLVQKALTSKYNLKHFVSFRKNTKCYIKMEEDDKV